jgi:hypothetical protein
LWFLETIRALREPPTAGARWTWGGFWWGPIYYIVHGLNPKGWILLLVSVVTFGLLAPFFWFYCAIDAGTCRMRALHKANRLEAKGANQRRRDAQDKQIDEKRRELDAIRIEREYGALGNGGDVTAPLSSGPLSLEERLERLALLREKGVLSDEEYAAKRSSLIDQL